jgi:hypothetical protein
MTPGICPKPSKLAVCAAAGWHCKIPNRAMNAPNTNLEVTEKQQARERIIRISMVGIERARAACQFESIGSSGSASKISS